jgi:hypothetical protein
LGQDGGTEIIGGLQPVYRVEGELVDGPQIGDLSPPSTSLLAPDGYAVGAISEWYDFNVVHGLRLVFHRDTGGRLDPTDAIESSWVGAQVGREGTHHSEGRHVVGIYGRINGNSIRGFAVILREKSKPKANDSTSP